MGHIVQSSQVIILKSSWQALQSPYPGRGLLFHAFHPLYPLAIPAVMVVNTFSLNFTKALPFASCSGEFGGQKLFVSVKRLKKVKTGLTVSLSIHFLTVQTVPHEFASGEFPGP